MVCLAGPSGSGKTVLAAAAWRACSPPTTGRIEFYGPVTSLLAIGDNLDCAQHGHREPAGEPRTSPARRARGGGALRRRGARFRRASRASSTPRSAPTRRAWCCASASRWRSCGRPSIVLIDDVLNVGDIGFQQKCLDRVLALKDAGLHAGAGAQRRGVHAAHRDARPDPRRRRHRQRRAAAARAGAAAGAGPPTSSWQVMRNLPEDAVDGAARRGGGGRRRRSRCLRAARHVRAEGRRAALPAAAHRRGGRRALGRCSAASIPNTSTVPGTAPLRFAVPIPVETLPNGDYTIGFHIVSISGASIGRMAACCALEGQRGREARRSGARWTPSPDGPRARGSCRRVAWEVEPFTEAQL